MDEADRILNMDFEQEVGSVLPEFYFVFYKMVEIKVN